jgi:carboxyl-terminal processing protease
MTKLCTTLLLLACLISARAQNPTSEEKLVATCKVWSYFKYFHDGPSNCRVNWDNALVTVLPKIKAAQTKAEFNTAIQLLITAAGGMGAPLTPAFVIPPDYNTNLNTNWFTDPIFDANTTAKLNTVKDRFRPHALCNVTDNSNYSISGKGWIYFNDEKTLPSATQNAIFPDADYRLLVAFRYWSYIEYFFNSKNLTDIPWDATLKKVVPTIDNASSAGAYHLGLLELVSDINDTHAASSASNTTYGELGTTMPAFIASYIENKVVVTKVFNNALILKVGDIVLKLNEIPIDTIINNRKKYISHSNQSALFRDLMQGNKNIFIGAANSTLRIEVDRQGTKVIQDTRRETSLSAFYAARPVTKYSKFEPIPDISCDFGYVNMGLLQQTDVTSMFNNMKNKDAIVFDIRNYPNGTAWTICPLFSPESYPFTSLNIPSTTYAGILSSIYLDRTASSTSSAYRKPIYILVNEDTQSQAEYTTMMLRAMPNNVVKVVGSQTAGADGNVSSIELPGGFFSYFSTLGVFYPDGTGAQRVGVKIDHFVKPTIKGMVENRDEVLDYVLQRLTTCKPLVATKDLAPNSPILDVSPNPTTDFVRVKIQNLDAVVATMDIVNVLGVQVQSVLKNATLTPDFEQQISLNQWPKGIYFVRLNVENKVFAKKIVVN